MPYLADSHLEFFRFTECCNAKSKRDPSATNGFNPHPKSACESMRPRSSTFKHIAQGCPHPIARFKKDGGKGFNPTPCERLNPLCY